MRSNLTMLPEVKRSSRKAVASDGGPDYGGALDTSPPCVRWPQIPALLRSCKDRIRSWTLAKARSPQRVNPVLDILFLCALCVFARVSLNVDWTKAPLRGYLPECEPAAIIPYPRDLATSIARRFDVRVCTEFGRPCGSHTRLDATASASSCLRALRAFRRVSGHP